MSDTWRVSAGQAVPLASRPFPWKLLVRAGLTVVLLALVAAAIAAVLWLRSYDPLAWDGGTSGGPAGSLAATIVDDGVHGTVYYVSAEEPGTFEAGFDVTNTGRLAVTLAGVEAPAGAGVLGLRMGRAGTWIDSTDGGGDGAIVPFAPVTIEPGQGRYLVVHLRVTAETTCGPDFASGTARVFSDVSLRFGYGGAFERTAAVEAPFAIVLDCGDLPVGAGGFGS